MKIAEGNESGPVRYLTFVFSSNGAMSFGRKQTIENASEARHGGYEVRRLLSLVREDAKNMLQRFLGSCRDKVEVVDRDSQEAGAAVS